MLNYTQLQRQGYKNITIPQQIAEIKNKAYPKLRLIQQQNLKKIERIYNSKGYLSQEESNFIFNLYYNFIVNGFTFNKKSITHKTKNVTPQHIGMRMLNNLINEQTTN